MNRVMTVKWRTLWRCFLGLTAAFNAVMALVASFTGHNGDGYYSAFLGSLILLLWSYFDEQKAHIAELERREKYAHELQESVVGRVADLMDSARRTDPIYQEAEARWQHVEKILRDARKDAS